MSRVAQPLPYEGSFPGSASSLQILLASPLGVVDHLLAVVAPIGDGMARGKIGPTTRLRVVNAILSGTHERGTSHYELLRAFLEDSTLERATEELTARGYKTHEFGDSVLIL